MKKNTKLAPSNYTTVSIQLYPKELPQGTQTVLTQEDRDNEEKARVYVDGAFQAQITKITLQYLMPKRNELA